MDAWRGGGEEGGGVEGISGIEDVIIAVGSYMSLSGYR